MQLFDLCRLSRQFGASVSHYNFQIHTPKEIFEASKELISVYHKDDSSKLLIKQSIDQLNSVSTAVEHIRDEMNRVASQLPEYPVVMAMCGVGTSLGPQLMAEISDITRFTRREKLTAFAGVDPDANHSGTYVAQSVSTTKKGSPYLSRTLFLIMDCLIQTKMFDDPVYAFMDKKRAEGKPYYVYMTAVANKFLRIYYGRVKEYLSYLPASEYISLISFRPACCGGLFSVLFFLHKYFLYFFHFSIDLLFEGFNFTTDQLPLFFCLYNWLQSGKRSLSLR